MMDDRYQTMREVASRLFVSEATMRPWIKGDDLPPIETSKGWQIANADLNAFLHQLATWARAQTTDGDVSLAEIAMCKVKPA